MKFITLTLILALQLIALNPQLSEACACGCGIFDVGTNSMFATGQGGMAFFEYNFLDQNQNHSRSNTAPSGDNNDREIKTSFIKAGAQYMFNRAWGAQIEVPYWSRNFKTTDADGVSVDSYDHASLGDIQLNGIYTGASDDMSTGFTFGLKLPTGDSTYANFDPDTEIGSGSTSLLLGIYHLGKITDDNLWNWFGQLNIQQPIISKPNYIPGNEMDLAYGVYYNGWTFKNGKKLAPIVELLASVRSADEGVQADSADSGFRRILVSPGLELDLSHFKVYADVAVPLYQYFNGNQLAAPIGYKLGTMIAF